MSSLPRRQAKPPLARTRGTLRIFRNGKLDKIITKGDATRQAHQARDAAYDRHGRQAFD